MLRSHVNGPVHFGVIEKVLLSPCVEHAISHDKSGNTFKYVLSTGESEKLSGSRRFQYMSLSDDGMRLVVKYKDHPIVIDVSSLREVYELPKEAVKSPTLQPNSEDRATVLRGNNAYVAYNSGEIIVWGLTPDGNNMTPVDRLSWDRGEENHWWCVDASSDGNMVIAATDRSALAIWDRDGPSPDTPCNSIEHLSEEAPIFLKLTSDKRFCIMGHKNSIYVLDIVNDRIEEISRRDSLGTPIDVVALENHLIIGYDKGVTVIMGINPRHSEFRKQTLVLQNNDDVITKILGVGISSDRLTCTTASLRMGRLIYTQWDLKTKEKVMARTFLLHWFRQDEPEGIAKSVVEFILPIPEPMLHPGQLGLVKAADSEAVNHIPCVILTRTGTVGDIYYNIMALPLCPPVPEELSDYAGVRCTVPAKELKSLTETELSRNETPEQMKKRQDLQRVASSRDERYMAQLRLKGDWFPHMCWRALRATNNNVVEAASKLQEGKGGIPDDGLDALLPLDEDEDMPQSESVNLPRDASSDNQIPDFDDDVEDDDY